MPVHPELRTLQGRKAAAKRWPTPPDVVEAIERDYAAARLREAIQNIVADAPPLDETQRAELAALLGGGVR